MPWPIDDQRDLAQALLLIGPDARPQVRERLLLEREIARRHGFACFADYFAERRTRGWGLNRLARDTGQTREWVRGVIRRYESASAGGVKAAS